MRIFPLRRGTEGDDVKAFNFSKKSTPLIPLQRGKSGILNG